MTLFDLYVQGIEEKRRKEREISIDMELARRLRSRTEEEAYAALLSLNLFPMKREAENAIFA